MRISTSGMHSAAISVLLRQQAEVAKTQNQLASGHRVNSPADDPVAAVQIQELERLQTESDQFGKNSDLAKNRLSLEEQALDDVSTALQRVRELTVEASNTATLSNSDRLSISAEMDGIQKDLLNIANRKDSNGEYLFSGFSSLTQPFSRGASGAVQYSGDQNSRLLQISTSQSIADSHSGFDVFMNIEEGNGTFVTTPAPANAGDVVVGAGTVVDATSWVPGQYTLSFTDPQHYQIVDASNAVVSTGTYVSGNAVSFNGVEFTLSGTPATGDSIAVQSAATKGIFSLMDGLTAALNTPALTASQRANLTSTLGGALQQVDQALDHVSNKQGQVGSSLSSLDVADSARSDFTLELQTSLTNVRDVDYADAVSRMNQQLLGLQAAQSSYSKIAQLSLFDYL